MKTNRDGMTCLFAWGYLKYRPRDPIVTTLSIVILKLVILSYYHSVHASDGSYAGCEVHSVHPKTKDQFHNFLSWAESKGLDIWASSNVLLVVKVMVCGEEKTSLSEYAQQQGIPFKIAIEDVQKVAELHQSQYVARGARLGTMSWDKYYELEQVYAWLDYAAKQHSNTMKVSSLAQKTEEGREIKLVTISKPGGSEKSGTVIDCLIHAREWTTGPVCTWIIHELTENSAKYDSLLDNVKFYIIPVLNPDGFNFTHFGARFWRKNRKVYSDMGNCSGIDLNRNYPAPTEWVRNPKHPGPCEFVYPGPHGGSENETQALMNFMMDHKDIDTYISLHCFGQYVLLPFLYTNKTKPENADEMDKIASASVEAIASAYGTRFAYGPAETVLYPASGTSGDWVKMKAGTKYTYTLELRPAIGDNVTLEMFGVQPEHILPVAKETWKGLQVLISRKDKDGNDLSPSSAAWNTASPALMSISVIAVHIQTLP